MATASPTLDSAPSPSPIATNSSRLPQQVRAEFIEMPGLTLTLPQAARLWGRTASQIEAVLTELTDGGFLLRDPRGCYRRRGCPRCS